MCTLGEGPPGERPSSRAVEEGLPRGCCDMSEGMSGNGDHTEPTTRCFMLVLDEIPAATGSRFRLACVTEAIGVEPSPETPPWAGADRCGEWPAADLASGVADSLLTNQRGVPEFPGQELATWVVVLDEAIWPWLYLDPLLIVVGLGFWATSLRGGH